ncbi:MAG: hypothetical protein IH840_02625 [Candidatus Heimdallarchaeota archaeon]|nr:hypothetical protein [Candidatus Heimdallarchaeota archaeon]
MNNRIVYVSLADNREEILLVYAEDLKFSGFQIDDFYDGDEIKDSKLWNNVIEPLQDRAMAVLQTA